MLHAFGRAAKIGCCPALLPRKPSKQSPELADFLPGRVRVFRIREMVHKITEDPTIQEALEDPLLGWGGSTPIL